MKVLSFFNVKGGVGKTTSAINISFNMASKYKKNVLLIDLDPQANSSFFFNCDKKEYNIADVMSGKINIKSAIYKTAYHKLDIIPSDNSLWAFEKELLDSDGQQQFLLTNALKEIENKYDIVVIDCTNMVGSILILNAFVASDFVFVPMRDEAWATKGLILTTQVIEEMQTYNPKLKFGGCFYSSWEKRKVNIESFNALKKSYGDKLINVKIRKSKSIPEMSYAHTPLALYDKRGTATEDYQDLTKAILKIIK